jgi:hypothetical protein
LSKPRTHALDKQVIHVVSMNSKAKSIAISYRQFFKKPQNDCHELLLKNISAIMQN